MISSNSERRKRDISDYFDALHGGKPPSSAPKPAQDADKTVKATVPAPKPNQP